MSAVPKLSPWFPGMWRPGLPGVYERMYSRTPQFSRWDGEFWFCMATTVERAAIEEGPSLRQMLAWRGLAEPPR